MERPNAPLDMQRTLHRAPEPGRIYYQVIRNGSLVVGINIVPLLLQRTIADEVFFQSDIGNAGIIEIGGLMLNPVNGIQLDAGMAVLFNPIASGESGLAGWIGPGITRQTEVFGGGKATRIVFNLADFRVFASIGDQLLRYTYMQLVETV
jgi:hypothetical protein